MTQQLPYALHRSHDFSGQILVTAGRGHVSFRTSLYLSKKKTKIALYVQECVGKKKAIQ